MNQTAQTQARYNAELYRLALASYMGESQDNMDAYIAAAAEAFNVPTDKVQRDVGIKTRNFFIAANR
jgi:hypothetical protein